MSLKKEDASRRCDYLCSIDAVEKYGEDGIDAVMDTLNCNIDTNVKEYGLKDITRMKSTNSPRKIDVFVFY